MNAATVTFRAKREVKVETVPVPVPLSVPRDDFAAIRARQAVQVVVSLAPDGRLRMEVATGEGQGRYVDLKPGREAETLQRVLNARANAQWGAGLDGSPVQSQVEHWEKHGTFPDERCALCRAEWASAPATRAKAKRSESVRGDGSVKVRTIPAKTKRGLKGKETQVLLVGKSAEELGL